MGSRRLGDNPARVYGAAEAWVACALREDDSLFTPGEAIWSAKWLEELHERFLNHPDNSGSPFMEKFRGQLAGSAPEVYQLAGELLYFHFLIPHSPKNKQQQIERVLGWSSTPVAIPSKLLTGLQPGLVGSGQFHQLRAYHLGLIIEFVEQWKNETLNERLRILGDPWAFKNYLMTMHLRSQLLLNYQNTPRAQREGLLHLVFPDSFEAIISRRHKRLIAEAFPHLVTEQTNDIDRQLQQIRPALEAQYESAIHLYEQPIRRQWDPDYSQEVSLTGGLESGGDDSLQALADDLLLPAKFLENIDTLLKEKKQVIFQGPPGTGKTYVAQALVEFLAEREDWGQLVQFHPSYSYEDFVQGFRPTLINGQPGFELRDGPLMRVAKWAEGDPDSNYFLVIDEINRGNLAKVFGELYFLLEYRERSMNLMYQKGEETEDEFALPENLYIIGTMNTADRSIALVDLALRRRFSFVTFDTNREPVKGLLRRWLRENELGHMEWVADVVDRANTELDDRHAAIGPSYFMKLGLDEARVERIWQHDVLPYIEERLFGEPGRLGEFNLDKLRSPATPGGSQGADGDGVEGHTDEEDRSGGARDA